MATGTLTDNVGTLTFSTNQVNSVTLNTANTFIKSNINLKTKVTKAVLTKTSGDTDHKTFQIQIPNGNAADITLTFTADTSGNVLVT